MPKPFHLLHLKAYPIYEQLLLEEALLRNTQENWCLINEGSSTAIVMGISGKKEELVNTARTTEDRIPLIKRFSGGGTVIVDDNTLFVTFICNKKDHPFPAYPEPILRWTESVYQQALPHPAFCLRENDFVIGEKKCGGNAQYIQKERWLHHTSFLWDFAPHNMEYLLHPKKTPTYRQGRAHGEFLCRLKDHFGSREEVVGQMVAAVHARYGVTTFSLDETRELAMSQPSRQATVWV